MKRLLSILIAALTFLPLFSADQADSRREKQLQREANAKIKLLQKTGWQVLDSNATLEQAVQKHFDQLIALGDDAFEIY